MFILFTSRRTKRPPRGLGAFIALTLLASGFTITAPTFAAPAGESGKPVGIPATPT